MNARLGSNELVDLLIAFVALTVAFAIAFSGGISRGSLSSLNANMLIISAIGVGTGFLLHELAHKFVAQRFGYRAEFKLSMQGLLMTFIFMFLFGIIFAAPGAVMISGRPFNPGSPYDYGAGRPEDDEYWDRLSSHSKVNRPELYISIAGVVTNLILALFFITLIRFGLVSGILLDAARYGMWINIVLAAFNMIPFGPLDGAKVLRANPLIWAVIGLPVIFAWLLLMFSPGLLMSILLG